MFLPTKPGQQKWCQKSERSVATYKSMCGERVQTAETWLRNPVEDGKYGGQDPGNRNEHPWSKAGLESHAAHTIAVAAYAQR